MISTPGARRKLSLIFAASRQAPSRQVVQTFRPVAGDAPGGGIPVADNEHLPVQQKHPVIARRRRHLVRASAVVGAAVTGGLHQDLVRAKRLAPGGGLATHAVKPVHPIVRIVEIVALFKLDEALKPVVA